VIRRHSLVWLRQPPVARDSPAAAWQQAGRPFMVCRTRPNERLSLGFCLPQPEGKSGSPARIAFRSDGSDIERHSRPPAIHEAAAQGMIPPDILNQLLAAPGNCTVRLIGSRLWETITGTCYTSETSDLDLVIDLETPANADAVCAFLAAIDSPIRLDAELSFPGLGEVHWKEWHSATDPLLVKSVHSVGLVPRSAFGTREE